MLYFSNLKAHLLRLDTIKYEFERLEMIARMANTETAEHAQKTHDILIEFERIKPWWIKSLKLSTEIKRVKWWD